MADRVLGQPGDAVNAELLHDPLAVPADRLGAAVTVVPRPSCQGEGRFEAAGAAGR